MIVGRRLIIRNIELQIADGIILGSLVLFSLLAGIFFYQVDGWGVLILKNIGVAAAVIVSAYFTPKIRHRFWKFLLRTATITLSYAYLFEAVAGLQLVLHGDWFDDWVLDFEQYVFGFQPTLWFERYTTPMLTEWMMFSYVIYVPFYPILCGIIYYKRGELPMEEYFTTLGLTNILCDVGFILFPVASPLYWISDLYTVPLDGYVWTYLGELMRSDLHYPGGSIPSPHAAAATIMWVMAFRYHRPTFYIISPVILSLYVSTFYLRYHYLTDAVVGIAVAALALYLSPKLMRAWDRLVERNTLTSSLIRTE